MPLWKQTLLIALLVIASAGLAAMYLPDTRPVLARFGIVSVLEHISLIDPAPEKAMNLAARDAVGKGAAEPTKVIAVAALSQKMNDIVSAIGTAQAARSVTLTADVSGRIEKLNVASGRFVEAGTVVAELDSEAAMIALDRAALILSDAQATFARQARLQATGASTDLLTEEAKLALKTAELAKREAEFEISRRKIVAPISGWLGILAVDVGDQITPTTEITGVEDRSRLIVEFRVPERVISQIGPGTAITATPLAQGGPVLSGAITALDNRVDVASRSLLVQASIANAGDKLRPGMALSITLTFTGDSHPAVDPLAIQWASDGAFVWVVREGSAARLPVRILQRNSDAVLIEADLLPNDLVVIEGVQALRPGTKVALAQPADASTDPVAPKN